MKNMNKKGVSIVELILIIAIGGVIAVASGVAGFAAFQNAQDNGVQGDLMALSDATQAFMVDSNGAAPLWFPGESEGSDGTAVETAGASSSALAYDYVQGRNDANLDFDGTVDETFTPNNILIPTYIESIPNPRRGGEVYLYSKGDASSREGGQAFAYSSVLGGPQAQDKINDNISVFNVADAGLENEVDASTNDNAVAGRLPSCTLAQLDFSALTDFDRSTIAGEDDETITYNYSYLLGSDVVTDGGFAESTITATAGCDIYSEGQGLRLGNFNNDNIITVNAR